MNFNIHEQNTRKLYKKIFFCFLTKKGGGQKFGRKFLIKKFYSMMFQKFWKKFCGHFHWYWV